MFPYKQRKSIKTETYEVKINICARYLKVTFGFHKLKKVQHHQNYHHHQGHTTHFLKDFHATKRHLWWAMIARDRFTNDAEGQAGVFQRTHKHTHTHIHVTADLKALDLLSLTYKHPIRQSVRIWPTQPYPRYKSLPLNLFDGLKCRVAVASASHTQTGQRHNYENNDPTLSWQVKSRCYLQTVGI